MNKKEISTLREKFFKECVEKIADDFKVNRAPHDMFEWFANSIASLQPKEQPKEMISPIEVDVNYNHTDIFVTEEQQDDAVDFLESYDVENMIIGTRSDHEWLFVSDMMAHYKVFEPEAAEPTEQPKEQEPMDWTKRQTQEYGLLLAVLGLLIGILGTNLAIAVIHYCA